MPETIIKKCLECGKPLGPGRSDRKYCDEFCKSAYNNRQRTGKVADPALTYEPDDEQKAREKQSAAMDRICDILVENRVKLLNMYALYERRLSLVEFNRFGINLNYYTSQHTDDYYEKEFKMCFDYGYHIDGDQVYLVYHGNELYFN
ncbi:hypothetical protein [Mucilaginibacter sp. 3215]|uniref:hypothetical protein n=1 Tax=Mucilaginibacter sp. 3215 TaxID=3373912 RepID=UPI003D1E84CA